MNGILNIILDGPTEQGKKGENQKKRGKPVQMRVSSSS